MCYIGVINHHMRAILKNEKRNAVIEGRLRHTTLATLAKYFASNGIVVRNKSDLLHQSLEMFLQILISKNMVEEVRTADEALFILEKYGLTNTNRGGRNIKMLAQQIADDNSDPISDIDHQDTDIKEMNNIMDSLGDVDLE